MGGQGTNQGVCKNGLYLVQYCPILYSYILILLRPKYAATKNSKCRKGSADDCVAWRLNRFFCEILSPSFWQQEKHVHFGSHFGARHPHSLGTRCCGLICYFSRAEIGDENDQLGGVNTAAYCSWCRVLPGRFNHQTLKCNHQSPPGGMA